MGREVSFKAIINYQQFRQAVAIVFPDHFRQGTKKIPLINGYNNGPIISMDEKGFGIHHLNILSTTLQSIRLRGYLKLAELVDALPANGTVAAELHDVYGYEDGALPTIDTPNFEVDVLKSFIYSKSIGDSLQRGWEKRLY